MRPKKKPYSMTMVLLGAVLTGIAGYYLAGGMRQGITIFEWEENMKTVLADIRLQVILINIHGRQY